MNSNEKKLLLQARGDLRKARRMARSLTDRVHLVSNLAIRAEFRDKLESLEMYLTNVRAAVVAAQGE